MDKITPENYEGYCELYKSKFMSNGEAKKLLINGIKSAVIPAILFILTVILNLNNIFVFLSAANFIVVPTLVMSKSMFDNSKKVKEQLATKYPNIDVNVSIVELERMLEEANILKYENIDGSYYKELDVEGYRNYIECEKIKNDVIKTDRYNYEPADLTIWDDKLEKAKVKIKTLNR